MKIKCNQKNIQFNLFLVKAIPEATEKTAQPIELKFCMWSSKGLGYGALDSVCSNWNFFLEPRILGILVPW